MADFPYIGSGPYCYSNSFAMMFGAAAPAIAVVEFATCSAFGMQLFGGRIPYFDPYGWTPEAVFADALHDLGWTAEVSRGSDPADALARLEAALQSGPVWVGPVEMGYLRYQPGKDGPIGADHYVVVLAVDDGLVTLHDPEAHPYATIPVADFMKAWRTETLDYGSPYTMRTAFRRVREVSDAEVIASALRRARRWLAMDAIPEAPPGTVGNAEAALALARQIEAGLSDGMRDHLVQFAVRVGARRAADAASCLTRIGQHTLAELLRGQARLIGSLQWPLVTDDRHEAAAVLRELAPTYSVLLNAMNSRD